jgi:hypothetical protein
MQIDCVRDLAYELYKQDWLRTHISIERQRASLCDYYKDSEQVREQLGLRPVSYEEYIEEFGFDGEIYATYEEFLHAEYMDHHYIVTMLEGNNLAEIAGEYVKDMLSRVRQGIAPVNMAA